MLVQLISRRRAAFMSGVTALGVLTACTESTGPTRRASAAPELAQPLVASSATTVFPCCDNIVFRRDTIGAGRIFSVNADGTGLRSLGHTGSNPSWSPDHSKIVLENGRIAMMNADGTGFQVFGDQGDGSPSFTPDGQKIVFVHTAANRSADILTMNVDGSNRQVLLKTPTTSESSPRFSPDGKKLAYMRTRKGATELVVWDLATDIHTVVAAAANQFGSESWSPDSKRLAFSTGASSTSCAIVIVDANGANRKNFPSGLPGCFRPTWSPDGTELAFGTGWNGGLFRGKVDVASVPIRITTAPNVSDGSAVWR